VKVGELARSSGLTVRTLHNYDAIGLLKPSLRSEAGYRLYSADDVGRLHAIQALRQLGLALGDIGGLLDGASAAPAMIVEQQMLALERQIAQATELRDRLALMRDGMLQGTSPSADDWLEALGLMGTYGKYFTATELKTILTRWRLVESDWAALTAAVRQAMDGGAAPTDPVVQPLARRWMMLCHHWLDGDFDLIVRWGEMYEREAFPAGRNGAPDRRMMRFMKAAIGNRFALLKAAGLDEGDLRGVRHVPEAEWEAVDAAGRELVAAGAAAQDPRVRALRVRWIDLYDRLAGHDPALRRKLLALQRGDPLLQAASTLAPAVRALLLAGLDDLTLT